MRVARQHLYMDLDGQVVRRVEVFSAKDGRKAVRQSRPGEDGDWIYNMDGVAPTPYRLPELHDAVGRGLWTTYVEGEKDADTLFDIGYRGTTTPGGAGKFPGRGYEQHFAGAKVAIIPDNDEPGYKHAAEVGECLDAVAAKLVYYEVPRPYKDVTEMVEAGLGLKDLNGPFDRARYAGVQVSKRPERKGVVSARSFCSRPARGKEDQVIGPILHRGQRQTLGAGTGEGKALDVATPIPTPGGWCAMGDIEAGDLVYGSDGKATRVTATSPVRYDRPCFRVRFSDGAEIVADAEHRWTVYDHAARRGEVRRAAAVAARRERPRSIYTSDQSYKQRLSRTLTTLELREMLQDGERPPSIPCAAPVEKEPRSFPIDPYVLGAWLGDGTATDSTITSHVDEAGFMASQFALAGETVSAFRPRGPSVGYFRFGALRDESGRAAEYPGQLLIEGGESPTSARARLRGLGVFGNKHIPEVYLNASISQRLALLQGIVDTDGSVSMKGQVEVTQVRERLARDIWALALGLGLRAVMSKKPLVINGEPRDYWRVKWNALLPVARMPRKAERLRDQASSRSSHRYVVAVDEVVSRPVKCIAVDAADSLYLAGTHYIATHNTMLCLQMIRAVVTKEPFLDWRGAGGRALVVDVEQGVETVKQRFREFGLDQRDDVDLLHEPDGLALDNSPEDVALVESTLKEGRYDVVVFDPLYQLYAGDANEESCAKRLMQLIDGWARRFGFAAVVPMHRRKPHPAAGLNHFTINEISGNGVYTRNSEVVLGLQRVSNGYSRLHFFKDRLGGLPPVGTHWGLLFDTDTHFFRRDPNDGQQPAAKKRVGPLLRDTPGMAIVEIASKLDVTVGVARTALKEAGAHADDDHAPLELRRWQMDPWQGAQVSLLDGGAA